MNLGIYKSGEGYWVRVMTAGVIAVITLATGAWLFQQGALIAESLPKSQWQMGLRAEQGEPGVGSSVELLGPAPTPTSPPPVLGTARVLAYSAETRTIRLSELAMIANAAPEETVAMRPPLAPGSTEPAANSFRGVVTEPRAALPAVEPLYVQGSLAAAALIIGSVLAYFLVGMRRPTVDFLCATDYEMKKVNWSTKREVYGSTMVVVGGCVVIATSLWLFDLGFTTVFQAIRLLKTG